MQALWFFSWVGLALAAPPAAVSDVASIPEARGTGLVPISAQSQGALNDAIDRPDPRATYVYHRRFATMAEAEAFSSHAAAAMPGPDTLYVLVDANHDGTPEQLDVALGVDAGAMGGAAWRVTRPLLIDTNADGVVDRFAWTRSVAALPWERVAAR